MAPPNDPTQRPFEFQGIRYRLVIEPDVRARDLRDGCVTLIRESDGEAVRVMAEDLNLPALPDTRRAPDELCYDLRSLLEQILRLGFDDEWVAHIGRMVRCHRLLRVPSEGAGRE